MSPPFDSDHPIRRRFPYVDEWELGRETGAALLAGYSHDLLRRAAENLLGDGDRSVHPMHHPLLPPAPALVPAEEAERLEFWLSPATDGELATVAFWQTVTALAAGRLPLRVRVEESTGLVAVIDDDPRPGRLARLSAFEAGVAAAGGIVSARMGLSARDAAALDPGGAVAGECPVGVRVVTYLIGCLPLAEVAALAREHIGRADPA